MRSARDLSTLQDCLKCYKLVLIVRLSDLNDQSWCGRCWRRQHWSVQSSSHSTSSQAIARRVQMGGHEGLLPCHMTECYVLTVAEVHVTDIHTVAQKMEHNYTFYVQDIGGQK